MMRSPIHMHTPISISLTTKPTLSLYFSPSTQFLTLSTTLVWNLMKQYSNIGIANPIKMLPALFTFFLIILHSHCNLSLATPTTPTTDSSQNQTVSKKDQIACTVCNECENPCPVPSTPPPPVVEYPPPPPPVLPQPELQKCPPPPQLPCPDNCNTPPSPSGPTVEPFPPNNRPNQPFPPDGPKPYLSPPNPVVPYFPYYYYSGSSNSLHLKLNPFVSSIVIFLTSLLCFF